MEPNYDVASSKAREVLAKYRITSTEEAPLQILKSIPCVLVLSYEEASYRRSENRSELLCMHNNHKAVTYVDVSNGKTKYVVIYNQKIPFSEVRKSLARELGHVVLGHDGTLPEEIRTAEAIHFADCLLEALDGEGNASCC